MRSTSMTAASRLSSRRTIHDAGIDRDGSGAASDRERERDRDRTRFGQPPRAQNLEDRVAELEFALSRFQQRLSNHASDLSEHGTFKTNVTEELRIQKEQWIVPNWRSRTR